ncbi:Hypothetical protein BFF97_01959 [Corynebacterium pseudotuberculosis]|nr:hypothetical protein CPI37_0943 [Corynebacterium pseudotuberculosis]ATV80688.1 Hypothetical protein BFF97_01959 [Corynebacterium pseudotuberculosis]AUY60493.1 Hypothetical protein BFG00_1106 [Corynebacterium pseudotuberculosis]KEX87568.1 hypothetical protein CPTD_01207 [Corynebacterium pseudotuberculosis]
MSASVTAEASLLLVRCGFRLIVVGQVVLFTFKRLLVL